jgi:hypothetical protein
MGEITEEATGRIIVLETHHLVGRSHRCSLRIPEASVSGEHASLRWTGGSWAIKDLGSRYGTFLNGQRLDPGVAMTLGKGSRIAFGREKHTWVVTDDGSPGVMVTPVEGGPALLSHDGMIAIPSPEIPAAVVFQALDGKWVLDQAGRVEVIKEHDPFLVEGVRWRLSNASPLQPTSMAGDVREGMALDEVELHFRVSRNEEHVEVAAAWRDRKLDLGTRSHHYMLLTLARARLRDSGAVRAADGGGWTDQEELLRLLQLSPERLNLDIFRVRRQFSAAGFIPAAGIVERRPAAKELRIGVSNIKVDVL